MKYLITIVLTLLLSSQSFAMSDLSSGSYQASNDSVRGMRFSSGDFNNILLDLAVIAGIVMIGKKLPKDKKYHFYAGALTGAVAGVWCKRSSRAQSVTNPRKRNFLCSLGAASVVGVLKEVYDNTEDSSGEKRGNVEAKDALITAAGGAVMGLTFL